MSTVPFHKPFPSEIKDKAPQSLQSETIVLATIFRENTALQKIAPIIKAEDFFTPNGSGLSWNGRMFQAMTLLAEQGSPIDTWTVIEWLNADPIFRAHIDSINSPGNTWTEVNIEHYAKVIREKSMQRKFLHKTFALQELILSGQVQSAEQIATDLELFTRETVQTNRRKQLRAVDFRELLTMDLPPVEFVIEPIVPYRGTTMLYAWRGVGKTYFQMELAFCVAAGVESVFGWPIPKKRKVVYVDGELDASLLQERAQEIARAHGMLLPEPGQLRLIGIDFQEDIRPKINSPEGRSQIEEHLEPGAWLILDNWSTLCPAGGEKDQETCLMLQDWFLDLRKQEITNSFLHHAGKQGEQRGFSGKEDILSCVLKLAEPQDYRRSEGLRAEVTIEKKRGKPNPDLLQPFEVTLTASSTGTLQWATRPLTHLLMQRAFQMFAVEMKPGEVAEQLGLKNRYVAFRWKKKFQENPDPNAWNPD